MCSVVLFVPIHAPLPVKSSNRTCVPVCLCDPLLTTHSYNTTQAYLPYDVYNASTTCQDIINTDLFDYDHNLDGAEFMFEIDVRTFSDAFAAGQQYLNNQALLSISGAETMQFTFNGFSYHGSYFTDNLYVGMDPIFCLIQEQSR